MICTHAVEVTGRNKRKLVGTDVGFHHPENPKLAVE